MRWLLVLVCLLCGGQGAFAQGLSPARVPVILVSIDGFRADYLQRGVTPALSALAAEGARSEGMRPGFPSITFPNHYTLVTGLYPDHHGIVANTMVDGRILPDSRFTLGDFTAVSDERWWDGAAPIWVTAKAQGLKTATMFWPGSEAPIQGVRPDLWAHFDASLTPDQRADIVLDWLDLPAAKRPDFLTLYFDQVDHEGHEHGPNSTQVNAALALVDHAIGRLVDGLKARNLHPDIIVVADHGMAETASTRVQVLDELVDPAQVDVVTTGAVAEIAPHPGAGLARLLNARGPLRCWRKGELPEHLHYGTNPRIPEIVCVAEPGWLILTKAQARKGHDGAGGEHGYDPQSRDMAALFMAAGPDIRSGVVIPPFDNVDVEPLLAHLLRIKSPPADGSLEPLRPILARP
jgi:ectonucleotide pyrophosphatase/phosphodiesterase family member 5